MEQQQENTKMPRGAGKEQQLSKIAAAVNPGSQTEANPEATKSMIATFVNHFETSALEIVQNMDDNQEDLIKKMVDEITKLQTKNMKEFEKAIGKIVGISNSMIESNNPKLQELGQTMQDQAKNELFKAKDITLTGDKDTFMNRLGRQFGMDTENEPIEKNRQGIGKLAKGAFSNFGRDIKRGMKIAVGADIAQEGTFYDRVIRTDEEKRSRELSLLEQSSNETKTESLSETFKKVLEETLKQAKEDLKKDQKDPPDSPTKDDDKKLTPTSAPDSEAQEDKAGISKDAQIVALEKTAESTLVIQENSTEAVDVLKQMLELLKTISEKIDTAANNQAGGGGGGDIMPDIDLPGGSRRRGRGRIGRFFRRVGRGIGNVMRGAGRILSRGAGAIVRGAGVVGGAIATGASAAGGALSRGASTAGNLITRGAGAIAEGASAAGGAISRGAGAIAEGASAAGSAVSRGASVAGGAISRGATAAGGAILRGGSKVLNTAGSVLRGAGGVLGKVGGVAKGVLGKAALPLAVGMAAYDAYKGWNADENATTGQKFKNAGRNIVSGLTFGLVDSTEDKIEKGEYQGTQKPVAGTAAPVAKQPAVTTPAKAVTASKPTVPVKKTVAAGTAATAVTAVAAAKSTSQEKPTETKSASVEKVTDKKKPAALESVKEATEPNKKSDNVSLDSVDKSIKGKVAEIDPNGKWAKLKDGKIVDPDFPNDADSNYTAQQAYKLSQKSGKVESPTNSTGETLTKTSKQASGKTETGKNIDSALIEAGTAATKEKMQVNVPPPTVIQQGGGQGSSGPNITAPGGVRNVRADDPTWLRFQQRRAVA